MAGDDPSLTDPVTAAFARAAAAERTAPPLEARYQSARSVPERVLGVLNGLLVLGILVAIAASTYALLNL